MPRALVVGAGFAGAVSARELADAGVDVVLIDRRNHAGGNAHDHVDDHGVLVHPYGPHIFHTNSTRVAQWLSRFTEWRPYEHRVLAALGDQLLPIPINRTTINRLYNLDLDEAGVQNHLERVREHPREVLTSEDAVLASVGRDLCEKFFRNYTKKQWGLDLSELSAGVAARIPVRSNDDDRYFTDSFQAMPAQGYAAMFKRMLDHPRIQLRLGVDFSELDDALARDHTFYTGPIDEYFGHRFGKLPYRSLRFEHEHLRGVEWRQPVGTINYPNEHDFTRITEFKHLTGQQHSGTSVMREYPQAHGEPYYPIPTPENERIFQSYRSLAEQTPQVTFVGRLAQYRYYNMDQVVAAGLTAARKYLGRGEEA